MIEFREINKTLFQVRFDNYTLENIQEELDKSLKRAPVGFFDYSPIVLNLSNAPSLDENWLIALIDIFAKNRLLLVGAYGECFSKEILLKHRLSHIDLSRDEKARLTVQPIIKKGNKTINQNIRSGQCIYAENSDLTIIGNISAGAEVLADGNITVLGHLRGRAFAGVKDNNTAHIFALHFYPELIAIAKQYYTREDIEDYYGYKNCLIHLDANQTMNIKSIPLHEKINK